MITPEDRSPDSNLSVAVAVPPPISEVRVPARWGEPILAADRAWTRFEIWLAMGAFTLEVVSMALWVCLKGFSTPADHVGAVVFRAVTGATLLGVAAHVVFAKRSANTRQGATVIAVFLGVVTAKTWITFGNDYASNLLNWYQQASFLTLLGGLRGVGTRLTMLLALVGGSLATGRGRHIVIDVGTRFVGHLPRTIMVLTGWAASTLVCVVAAWGFFDHISIENFGARADDGATRKLGQVVSQLGEDFFIARKQLELDFKSVPHVLLRGERYSDWLTGKEWNAWADTAGFRERYGQDAAEALHIPENETRAPLIVIPGRGEPRGDLINVAYLVFPIGLLVIALRFVVRGLLALSGHVSTNPEESDEASEFENVAGPPGTSLSAPGAREA
jgi:TRAP-type C4-dicarboxylate transport system permease small subunit